MWQKKIMDGTDMKRKKLAKNIKRSRQEKFNDIKDDFVVNWILEHGGSVLHLEKEKDETMTLEVFKDE